MSLNNNDSPPQLKQNDTIVPPQLEQNYTILPSQLERSNTSSNSSDNKNENSKKEGSSKENPNIEDWSGTKNYIFKPSSFEDTKSFGMKRQWVAGNMLIPTNNSIPNNPEKCFEEYRLEDMNISQREEEMKKVFDRDMKEIHMLKEELLRAIFPTKPTYIPTKPTYIIETEDDDDDDDNGMWIPGENEPKQPW